jgi:hypothetical protein
VGAKYVRLPKTPPQFAPISTSEIVRWIKAPGESPLRVDFGGGWLDVPAYARPGAFVVNCAISPTVSLREWAYERNAGLGGSGAWALLNGKNGVGSELDLGVGWQDPAVIGETGLCVWHSGARPLLEVKTSGEFLRGRMAIYWTGSSHHTPGNVGKARDYDAIVRAGALAREAVWTNNLETLAQAVRASYAMQMGEGMQPLPGDPAAGAAGVKALGGLTPLAWKYCGGGHGGYAVYLCRDAAERECLCAQPGFRAIEPYLMPQGV